jgi:hypothetical protein
VRPGTYAEDLTLYDNLQVIGATGFSDGGTGVEITGKHTPPSTGGFCFRNVKLISATDVMYSTAAGTSHLIVADCAVAVTNGYLANVPNWTSAGTIELWDVNCGFGVNDGCVYNTGGSTVLCFSGSFGTGTANPMTVSGNFFCDGAEYFGIINLVTGANADLPNSVFNQLTTAGNAACIIRNSVINAGSSTAITHNSSSSLTLSEVSINTSNATAIDGTGTINLGSTSFLDSNTIANTITITSSEIRGGNFISRYVVDPDGMTPYTSIQSAIDAANADGVSGAAVYVKPGTYTENLTFYDGIDLWGAVGVADTQTCKIIGKHTPPSSGTLTVRNIFLQSATHIFDSNAAGSCGLILIDCAVNVTNGYTFNLPNWTGGLTGFDIGEIGSTNDGWINNSGGSFVFMVNITMGKGTGNTCTISGNSEFYNVHVQCPISFTSTGTANISGGCWFDGTVSTADTATVSIGNSLVSTGATQAITHESANQLSLADVTINSSNNPAIGGSGAGNLLIGSITYLSNSSIAGTITKSFATRLETGELKLDDSDAGVLFAETGVVDSTGAMTNGQLVIGSTGSNPVAANLASAGGTVTITNGAGTINLEAGAAVPTSFVTDSGTATPAANVLNVLGGTNISTSGASNNLTIDLAATIDVSLGGTGVTSITDHALIVGSGAAAITEIGPLTDGQLCIGSTGNDPVAASLTQPAAGLTITGGGGSITFALNDDLSAVEGLATTGIVSRTAANTWAATSVTQHAVLIGDTGEVPANLGPLTNGQLVVGSTGVAPVAATLTAGSGIAIANGAGSITVSSANGGMTWVESTGAAQAMAVNTAYGANRGAGVTFTLPASAAQGTLIKIVGIAGLWALNQNAGQTVHVGAFSTTTGVGGSLTATNAGDCITLRCITTDTDFRVENMMGNPTIV